MPTNKAFRGKGIVYLENDAGQLIDVGNCTAFSYSAEEQSEAVANMRTAAGGNYAQITRIGSVNIAMTLSDFSAENLSVGLFGNVSAHTGAAQSNEAQTTPADVSVDFLLKTDFVIDTDQTVTVVGYVEGTDFEVRPAGLIILAAGSIPASTALDISYTSKTVDLVEAFVNAAQERRVVLDGLNEAQSGAPFVVDVYRAKFGPAQETPFIGDTFGEISLSGEALIDETITTPGLSQYLKLAAA